MKKPKPTYDILLFAILAVAAFLPIVQQWTGLVRVRPLKGVEHAEALPPQWSVEAFLDGRCQREAEAYASRHFGFREPVIRIYNQYLWTCFGKTYAHDIVGGKHGWLFTQHSVDDYYGTEMHRWYPSPETAMRHYDSEAKYLLWARHILKENGVDLMVFMAPEKSFLYPEYLPIMKRDSSTFNAREHFERRFVESGFPYIESTRWFQQMADTASNLLIPQTGGHWNFSSVYAADSLFRHMASLKGIRLPALSIGEMHESSPHEYEAETDLEQTLNLAFPIHKQGKLAPEAEVSVVADSGCATPKALFVGNSFFWRFAHYIPLEEMFEYVEFWYYFSTAYHGAALANPSAVGNLDLVEKLLDFDYVVWINTASQMNKGTSGFANRVILNLCFGKDEIDEMRNKLIDSISRKNNIDVANDRSQINTLWQKADSLLNLHPGRYFPELMADSLPASRNPRIQEVLTIKEIRRDSVWMANLRECQTVIQNAPLETVLLMEAHNIMEHKPLLRDMPDPEAKRDRVQKLVEDMVEEIKLKPEIMDRVREMAEQSGVSVEEQTELAARWIVNDQIRKGIIDL